MNVATNPEITRIAEADMLRRLNKPIDTTPPPHGTLSAEMRVYLMERRRALLTELNALNKMLGLKTE